MQVAELEAQAVLEPPPVSEKEGPGQTLEQLEALVQTKDQVSTERVSVCVHPQASPSLTSHEGAGPPPSTGPRNSSPLGDPDAEEPGWWAPRGP